MSSDMRSVPDPKTIGYSSNVTGVNH